jgi:signal transduction histidine kinase
MNKRLQAILDLLQQSGSLTPEEKKSLADAVKESDKEITITEFKLERTEKVKRTTAILLEETIAELEQKRKSVETQNRELEIEAALERVRSRSIAMRQSSELGDLSFELVKQVQALGISTWHCAFNIYDEDQESSTEWGSNANGSYPIYKTPREGIFRRYYDIGQSGETLHVEVIGEDKCADHYAYLCTLAGVGETLVKLRDSGISFPKSQIDHVAYFKYGYLLFITFEPAPEAHDIFKRFAKVFEQTYTRFLDLQKAEAQAREAKIEAGLERVRSRAMAMQTSEELNALIGTVFTELTKLDLVLTRCVIMTYDQKTNDARWWMANSEAPEQPMNFYVQYHEHPPNLAYFSAWRERTVKWIYPLEGKVKKEWYDFIFRETELRLLPDFVIAGMKAPDRVYLNASFYNSGNLTLASLEPLSDEHFDILIRFAKVFDLTYTRFNDLKQAEAQAREAKIEAALERVRSRTMAMQRSEELVDVASILFQQVKALGVPQWNCGLNIWEIGDKEFTYYPGSPDGKILPTPCKIPLTEHPVFISFDESRKRGDELYVYEKGGEYQAGHYRYMLSLRGVGDLLQSMLDAGFQLPTFQIDHVVNFSHGNLLFITYEQFPEMHDVFKRFGRVFEQTYTRFIDLQKAEAQAREAKIETALERVRSKTMAMHHSEELKEVISVTFEQLKSLNIVIDSCIITLFIEGSDDLNNWVTSAEQKYPQRVRIPYFKHPLFDKIAQAKKKPGSHFTLKLSREENQRFYKHILEKSEFGKIINEDRRKMVMNADSNIMSFANFKHTGLRIGNFHNYTYTHEENNTIHRFANVFEQTYTRFLDLQKAEAQAREAQIEAALEKVRSRSLAMHKSDEVGFVVDELFLRMKDLEIGFDSVNILEFTEDAFQVWAAYKPGKFTVTKIPFSKSDIPYVRSAIEAKNSGRKLFTHQYTFEEKNLFLNYLFDETHFKNLPDERKQFLLQCPCYTVSIGFAKSAAIQLQSYSRAAFSESENNILKRFVNVFEQAYTRFLDLQQAEGQAREAQIQLALERVRARTMAMQHSNELRDAASVLFQQVKELGIDAWTCGFSIWDEDRKTPTAWLSRGVMQPPFKTPLTENQTLMHFYEAAQRGESLFVEQVSGETLTELYRYLGTLLVAEGISDEIRKPGYSPPTSQVNHVAYFSYGYLLFITYKQYPEAHDIFKRFAKVFEQTYTRYLDLKKAEAQAREAKIEAGLERVRSRAMAMQTSEELNALIGTVFTELTKLDLVLTRCVIMTYDQKTNDARWWMANSEAPEQPMNFYVQYHEHPPNLAYFSAWRERTVKWIYPLEGKVKKEWDDFIFSETELRLLPDFVIAGMKAPDRVYLNASFYNSGNLTLASLEPLSDEHFDILIRFAKVFDLTYTRFNDLKQAEAQAREAKIETALERVRSRTMAMQHSGELTEISFLLIKQVLGLGIKTWGCAFNIFDEDQPSSTEWFSNEQGYKSTYKIPREGVFLRYYEAALRGASLHVEEFTGDACIEHYKYLSTLPGLEDEMKIYAEHGVPLPTSQFDNVTYFKYGYLLFVTYEDVPEAHDTFKRFAKVFEQTYTRFLDLQKAEAQTRESQIEVSLERVRSKAMAMHKSEDLTAAVAVVFDELEKLNLGMSRCGIGILNKEKRTSDVWTTSKSEGENMVHVSGDESMDIHPLLQKAFDAWLRQEDFTYFLQGEDLADYYRALQHTNFRLPESETMVKNAETLQQHYYVATFPAGALFAFRENPFADEAKTVVKRFANVFNLTYKRFQDIQKAETQAREATIEASLEKVRGKAMAMHNSNDLTATASLVFTELRKLGIDSFRSGVGLLTRENRNVKLYSATSSEEGGSFSLVGWAVLDHHPVLSKTYDSWINNEDYYPVLKGEILKSYYENILATFTVPLEQSEGYEQYGYFLPFSEGLFYGWSEKPYTETEIKILHRFRGIVDLTFRRYMELEKSESIAKEAIRQASLDRVRAEIASMRTTNDLDRITPLIWKELNILSIPFVRCGVFIMDDFQQQMHTFLSTPEGEAIAAFHLPYETPGNTGEILSHWRNKQMYISHWDETAFSDLGEQLVKQGAIPSKDVYMSTIPSEGIHLHCLPFLQGMLYVGNTTQLKEDDIHLIQSVADAFSTAYARYEDFNKLESAKAQIEKTLTDLKQTQNLLVQSEKMASLGELTAGIAHEIQNPLNFVNNFSEVSNELLEEMKDEIEKGNYDEVEAITNNIKQNLEKILHHGKRADGIVKGMLQHSRSSSGVKEPTDINALADEYLRLAYHGFRAKDKSFNASTNTDLDKSIGKINVVPQDIGRVVLNLITNAFYAVTEKQKKTTAEYQPTVFLSTKRRDDYVLISVKDNGNGIPEQIREKIFQPFFTTKPTGQGTGLGLSLSYDIVKAHGGELRVDTKESEGSEFVLQLPLS